MGDATVRFQRVSKRFRLGCVDHTLRDLAGTVIRRLLGREEADHRPPSFWALREVDFTVGRGESVGIIGPNGAGKSTLLKLLAGILRPDEGKVEVRGRMAALLEIGAGFHGDLTGRENIFLNGAVLGMSRREIQHKLPAIVEFAGVGRFLDIPVKRYSSGMYARLGFSIAVHVDPEVLLVDEVLSVGDAVFRLRCVDRMRRLLEAGTTLIFVSHNLDQVQSVCTRTIVLEGGKATYAGPTEAAVSHYLQAMSRAYSSRRTDVVDAEEAGRGAVELIGLRFEDDLGEELVWVRPARSVRAVLRFRLHRRISRLVIELNMRATQEENVLSFNSARDGLSFRGDEGTHVAALSIPRIPLSGGQYFWNARMWDADTGVTLLDTPLRFPMVIDDEGRSTGRLVLEHSWSFATSSTRGESDFDRAFLTDAPCGEEKREALLLC